MKKGRHPILRFIGRTIATLICLGIMAGSLVAVGAVYYVVQATANDGDLLDLDNIELSQSSVVMATDPDTGAQVEYATLRSSNSHRVWADLEQIPTNLQYAFICTEDKDFYNEPGVNFKRTIGAMVNEVSAAHLQLQAGCIHAGAAAHQEPDRRQQRQRHRWRTAQAARDLPRPLPEPQLFQGDHSGSVPEHHQLYRHHSGRADCGQRVL